jgi:SAM-dependent methyltransferase
MADRAERARSFGGVADAYDRGRPGYPAAAITWLLGPEPLDVVDLGAGTGKLTEALVAAGHRVVAVEPLAQMSALLRAKLPGVTVLSAHAEATGLADASVDAAVAGAAFHWFDQARVFPEIRRILRPPGMLGLLGNRFDRAVAWIDRFATVAGSQGTGGRANWPDAEALGAWFATIEDGAFPHAHPIDRGRLRDLAVSRSHVATMAPDQRRALLQQVDAVWDTEPELQGRDEVALAYVTQVRRARGVR